MNYQDETNHTLGKIAADIEKLPEEDQKKAWALITVGLKVLAGAVKGHELAPLSNYLVIYAKAGLYDLDH